MGTLRKKYKPKEQNIIKLKKYLALVEKNKKKQQMGYGSIYPLSWWGNANEANGWGIVYPTNAGGSSITVDTLTIKADSTTIKADATEI